jgi:hypothetical protein
MNLLINYNQMKSKKLWIEKLNTTYKNLNIFFNIKNLQIASKKNNIEIKNISPQLLFIQQNQNTQWFWFKYENIFLQKIKKQKEYYIKHDQNKTINKKYKENIILKWKKEKKIKFWQKYQIDTIKQIIKDLVILNWEQNPQNLIINTRYNYSYVIKKYTTINNNILQANTRTNILNFAWYFQRIYKK